MRRRSLDKVLHLGPSPFNNVWRTTQSLSRLGFVLATITIVASLAFWTWTDFTDVRRDAEAKVSNAALAIDELARHSLLAIDVVLESVVARVAEQGLDKLASEPERENLRRIASRLPESGAVFVADKTGDTVAGTAPYQPPSNVSDRDWFNILKQGKEDIHVGRALRVAACTVFSFRLLARFARPMGASLALHKLELR